MYKNKNVNKENDLEIGQNELQILMAGASALAEKKRKNRNHFSQEWLYNGWYGER